MTDNDKHENGSETENEPRRVKDASHTHPDTDESFGDTGTYTRGKETEKEAEEEEDDEERVADGGRRTRRTRRVKDASHTPPGDVSAQDVYDRGMEGREDTV